MKTQEIIENLPLKNYVYLALFLPVALIIAIFFLRPYLPPQLPLFYGNAVGEGQLVSTFGILLAPAAAILLTVINIFTASVVKDQFLKKILSMSSLFVSILITITVIKVIFLVGLF